MGLLKKITKWIRRAKKAREQRRRFDVEWTLPSGLTVQVEDQGEWLIYNDIFVDGEYDLPLQKALKSIIPKDIVTIVDVGANVGFFALKAADWFFRNCNTDHDFRIVCIEGSPHVFEKLQGRVLRETLLAGRITLIHGLVGQRAGKGKIVEKPFHAMNRVDALAKSKEKWYWSRMLICPWRWHTFQRLICSNAILKVQSWSFWKVVLSFFPKYVLPYLSCMITIVIRRSVEEF